MRPRILSVVCERLEPEIQELKDIRKHFVELRAAWESKVATNEIQFLRAVADLQGASQHRSTLMESNFREIAKAQHADYLGALDRTNSRYPETALAGLPEGARRVSAS